MTPVPKIFRSPLTIGNYNPEWMEHEIALTVSAIVGPSEMTVRKNMEQLVMTDYFKNIRRFCHSKFQSGSRAVENPSAKF